MKPYGLLLAAAACTTLREVPQAQFIPQHNPAFVWVTTTDHALVRVTEPRIDGDTLRGTWPGGQGPVAIPLNRIQSVRAKTPAVGRTILVSATLAFVGGYVVWALAQPNSNNPPAGDCSGYAEPEEC